MDTDLIALAGALEASGIEFVVVAAGETSLRETLQNLIVALTNTAAPDHGLIESIAQRLGVKISASTRRTPLHDNLAVRFSDPQLRIESQSTNGEAVATLFMLHNNNVYTWYGPVSAKFPGSPVKLVTSGLGIAGTSSLHVSAVGSLGSFLKECVRVHKDNLKSPAQRPNAPTLEPAQQTATPGAPAQHAPVPSNAIEHDRHDNPRPNVAPVPGLMSVKHGQLVPN